MIIVPTGATPTMSDFVAGVRTDLFDAGQRLGDAARWSDADLARAVERANEKYSTVAPLMKEVVLATAAGGRIYARPGDAWWVERVEYPQGMWPRQYRPFEEMFSPLVAEPIVGSPAPSVTAVGVGGLSAGLYGWGVSYVVPGGGETLMTALVSGSPGAARGAQLGGIPTGPYGVSARNVYRTQAGGATYTLAGVVADNVGTAFTDVASDASIAAAASAPLQNTTAGIAWFEVDLSSAMLPADASGFLQVRYAARHELDANGSTVPERHYDFLSLGAQVYAVGAYLVPVMDNFEYVDGEFRDRVDDTKSAQAWLALLAGLNARWLRRLTEVREESNAAVSAGFVGWGDKPIRWDRL